MTLYRPNPSVTVEAFKFESPDQEFPQWFCDAMDNGLVQKWSTGKDCLHIMREDYTLTANIGDYVIRGVNDKIHVVTGHEFDVMYEKAEAVEHPQLEQ